VDKDGLVGIVDLLYAYNCTPRVKWAWDRGVGHGVGHGVGQSDSRHFLIWNTGGTPGARGRGRGVACPQSSGLHTDCSHLSALVHGLSAASPQSSGQAADNPQTTSRQQKYNSGLCSHRDLQCDDTGCRRGRPKAFRCGTRSLPRRAGVHYRSTRVSWISSVPRQAQSLPLRNAKPTATRRG
jgi:hypothetical protein